MNQEQLNAIKERVAKATSGPWEYDNEERGIWNNCGFNYLGTVTLSHIDADFIANAREDVPALIAEVERLNKELNKSKVEQMDLLTDKAFERSEKRKYIKTTHLVNEENKHLRKALEYYADTKHYEPYCIPMGDYASDVTEDNGEIARKVLEGGD